VGSRAHSEATDGLAFPADDAARRHGASVEKPTTDGEEAYASVAPRGPTAYREVWLPA